MTLEDIKVSLIWRVKPTWQHPNEPDIIIKVLAVGIPGNTTFTVWAIAIIGDNYYKAGEKEVFKLSEFKELLTDY